MKKRIPSSGLFLLAWMLVAAVNGAVLSGVAYNRSGPPEARIVLSERELPLAYRRHEENSGLALRLAWRTIGEDDDRYGRRSIPKDGARPAALPGRIDLRPPLRALDCRRYGDGRERWMKNPAL